MEPGFYKRDAWPFAQGLRVDTVASYTSEAVLVDGALLDRTPVGWAVVRPVRRRVTDPSVWTRMEAPR
jgi:hypothetical protein